MEELSTEGAQAAMVAGHDAASKQVASVQHLEAKDDVTGLEDAVAQALQTMHAVQAAGAQMKEQVDVAAQAAAVKGMSKVKLFPWDC